MTTFDEAYEELRALHEAYDASDGAMASWRAFQARRSALLEEGGQAGHAAVRYEQCVEQPSMHWGCW